MIHFDVTVKTPLKGESAVLVKLLTCAVAVIVGAKQKSFLAKTKLGVKFI